MKPIDRVRQWFVGSEHDAEHVLALLGRLYQGIDQRRHGAMVGHEHDGANIVIFSLAVLPEFQKQGIAGQLLLQFIEASKKLGKQKIMLICKSDLVDYYQKYGFVYMGESASTHGGCKWHEMVLPLQPSGS